tara:strand:+ start:772 stop:2157 length:1386 start_codon:yes stop_codon:yes gene_type:complete
MTTLKPKQQQFVNALIAAGHTTSPVTRADLVSVANSLGSNYAPAWIVKDASRKAGNACFDVPEVEGGEAPAPVASTPKRKTRRASAPATAPKAVVGSSEPTAQVACAMGLTGGESASLTPAKMDGYVPFGYFKDIEAIIRSGMFYPVFITGLSGNGKTTMVDQVCAKLKRQLYRVNITIETDEDDLLGGFRLINGETVWVDGPVVVAMKTGGVLLLDEMDLASHKIMCLQPVLEGKGVFLKKIGQWVKPAAGFTVFATANTKGKGSDDGRFVGTGVMNEAFLDRFPVCLEQEYPSNAQEKKIVKKKMAILGAEDVDFADHLVKWADVIRKAFYEGAVDEIITTRRLLNICEAFAIFDDKMRSVEMAIARFDDDTREAFRNLYTKVDAEANAVAEEENTEAMKTASRIDLKGAGYSQKDEVKSRGAKFDSNTKTWHITGEQFTQDEDFWNGYAPVINTDCPF